MAFNGKCLLNENTNNRRILPQIRENKSIVWVLCLGRMFAEIKGMRIAELMITACGPHTSGWCYSCCAEGCQSVRIRSILRTAINFSLNWGRTIWKELYSLNSSFMRQTPQGSLCSSIRTIPASYDYLGNEKFLFKNEYKKHDQKVVFMNKPEEKIARKPQKQVASNNIWRSVRPNGARWAAGYGCVEL